MYTIQYIGKCQGALKLSYIYTGFPALPDQTREEFNLKNQNLRFLLLFGSTFSHLLPHKICSKEQSRQKSMEISCFGEVLGVLIYKVVLAKLLLAKMVSE